MTAQKNQTKFSSHILDFTGLMKNARLKSCKQMNVANALKDATKYN
jgi:hypothetical protein